MRIDFHCHVLPKMDDGSASSKESLEMLKSLKMQGVELVCCTPHFYPENENPDSFISRRESCYERLCAVAEESGFELPSLVKGAEVAWYTSIGRSEEIQKLCLEGTDKLLLEMPFTFWSRQFYDSIVDIKEVLGLTPVLAHIDRYLEFITRDMLRSLVFEHGVELQINASSVFTKEDNEPNYFFSDNMGLNYNPIVFDLLNSNMISYIGSDAHNMGSRAPAIGRVYDVLEEEGYTRYFKGI